MAAATVLRVKRRLEDSPQDALVIFCKRIKTVEDELSPSLFVFTGSVDNQDTAQIKNIVPKTKIKLKPKTDVNDIINKIRQDHKEISTENRYEVVKSSRGLKEDALDLIDLHQRNINCDEANYTYDLYIPLKANFDISMLDNLVRIENYETDLILGTYKENDASSDEADDDDDSNDENNWRNDYPDSEHSSIDEDDMIAAMEKCDLDDLSSDEGEDQIYTDPSDIFNADIKHYGAAYAKYKAKVMAEENTIQDSKHLIHSTKIKDLDEDSIDGYKDDSDDGFYYGQDDYEQCSEKYRDENYNPN